MDLDLGQWALLLVWVLEVLLLAPLPVLALRRLVRAGRQDP